MSNITAIKDFLGTHGIENYTINRDRSVDVDGDVELGYSGIKEFPFKFGRINGNFDCEFSSLSSLLNCPDVVTGGFNCQKNDITSLEHFPKEIGGYIDISENDLKSLEGCIAETKGDFYCGLNRLTSLKHGPTKTEGDFFCANNELTNLEYCPKYIGDRFYCSNNKLTTLEYCPIEVGSFMDVSGNNISNFKGFNTNFTSEKYKRPITLGDNETVKYNPIIKLIGENSYTDVILISPDLVEWLNTYKVINGTEVNLKRLKYVCQEFDMSINLEKIKMHYTIK
jgi:hypothetical protein